MLWDFNQVLTVCQLCHEKIDANKELKEEIFQRLRGEDELKH